MAITEFGQQFILNAREEFKEKLGVFPNLTDEEIAECVEFTRDRIGILKMAEMHLKKAHQKERERVAEEANKEEPMKQSEPTEQQIEYYKKLYNEISGYMADVKDEHVLAALYKFPNDPISAIRHMSALSNTLDASYVEKGLLRRDFVETWTKRLHSALSNPSRPMDEETLNLTLREIKSRLRQWHDTFQGKPGE